MEVQIRLDQTGSPYLIISCDNTDKESFNAQEDAEKLFFTQVAKNGGKFHCVEKGKSLKILVVSNVEKRGFYNFDGNSINPLQPRVTLEPIAAAPPPPAPNPPVQMAPAPDSLLAPPQD